MTDRSSRTALREEMRGCTILLVDDEEANLDLLEALLGAAGFRKLVRTSDARQALPMYEQSSADIVLLDIHMPHRDGLELLGELRARVPEGEYCPVLVLTADMNAQVREGALSLGAHDFVTKPFDTVEVLLRVENLLETRILYNREHLSRVSAVAAGRRSALAAEWSRVLASSLDSSASLAQLPRLVVPTLADACVVMLRQPAGLVVGGEASTMRLDVEHWLTMLSNSGELAPGTASGECVAPLPDGRPARLLLAPVRDDQSEVALLVLARVGATHSFPSEDRVLLEDLAARAGQAAERARLYAAAALATRQRERLLAVVAHDLRNPLGAVAITAELLASMLPPDGDSYTREALGSICRATARMQALVEDLLDAAALQQNVMRLRAEPHDAGQLLSEAESMLRPLAVARDVELTFTQERAGLPAPIVVDGSRLLQLLSNLVGNAIRFTPPGKSVTVTWSSDADGLAVTVADDGPGIPPDALPNLFTAFWQAQGDRQDGVGLGLWIASAIAHAHGGHIRAISPDTGGAAFHLHLPSQSLSPTVGEVA